MPMFNPTLIGSPSPAGRGGVAGDLPLGAIVYASSNPDPKKYAFCGGALASVSASDFPLQKNASPNAPGIFYPSSVTGVIGSLPSNPPCIMYGKGVWVMSYGNTGIILQSADDGVTWTSSTFAGGNSKTVNGGDFVNGYFLIYYTNGSVAYSLDGYNFTIWNLGSAAITCCAFGKGLWVFGTSGSGLFYYSGTPGGGGWTAASTVTSGGSNYGGMTFYNLVWWSAGNYGGGLFVGHAYSGGQGVAGPIWWDPSTGFVGNLGWTINQGVPGSVGIFPATGRLWHFCYGYYSLIDPSLFRSFQVSSGPTGSNGNRMALLGNILYIGVSGSGAGTSGLYYSYDGLAAGVPLTMPTDASANALGITTFPSTCSDKYAIVALSNGNIGRMNTALTFFKTPAIPNQLDAQGRSFSAYIKVAA